MPLLFAQVSSEDRILARSAQEGFADSFEDTAVARLQELRRERASAPAPGQPEPDRWRTCDGPAAEGERKYRITSHEADDGRVYIVFADPESSQAARVFLEAAYKISQDHNELSRPAFEDLLAVRMRRLTEKPEDNKAVLVEHEIRKEEKKLEELVPIVRASLTPHPALAKPEPLLPLSLTSISLCGPCSRCCLSLCVWQAQRESELLERLIVIVDRYKHAADVYSREAEYLADDMCWTRWKWRAMLFVIVIVLIAIIVMAFETMLGSIGL